MGVNFGIGKDTTVGVMYRLPKYHSIKSARAVVLAIGFNDLKRRDNDAIIQNISSTLAEIPAEIPVLLCGVMPVDEGPKNLVGFNLRIVALNEKLASMGPKRPNTVFLDPVPVLADESGVLPAVLHFGDGIHLSPKGYNLWIGAMIKGLADLGIEGWSPPESEL